MKRRNLGILTLAALAVGCSDDTVMAPDLQRPDYLISDAMHAGKAHFYFLPPMVAAPTVNGTFDADLSPAVEICVLAGTACGSTIATFTTTTGPGSETVRLDPSSEHYVVNWHTDAFNLDPALTYRIRVLVDGVELGFADVDVVSSGRELKNVRTGEFIPLLDGRTLPIKFRIETGFLARIEVVPDASSVVVTLRQQFTAVLRDLHGGELSGSVAWDSDDNGIASVDQTGLATGVADGAVAITASASGVSGTASLEVIGVARIEVVPMEASAAPGNTQQFIAILYDEDENVISGPLVTWASSDEDVATVDPSGLATAVDDGEASITASAAGATGSATLAVIGGMVLDAGGNVSCAVVASGQAYCWGGNGTGSVGDGTTTPRFVPTPVAGGLTFRTVNAGLGYVCGITIDDLGYCWGSNSSGMLGDGTTTQRSTPTAVAGGLHFVTITAGSSHACGVTTSGQAYCWGSNSNGQLGDATTAQRLIPTPVTGGLTFAMISGGGNHTCGITGGGQAFCWGENTNGRLGDGTTTRQLVPTAVTGGLTFTTISAGSNGQTCGVTPANVGYCWGFNGNGRLGDGTATQRLVPTLVSGSLSWMDISTGGGHTCGVSTTGSGYCWGFNGDGRLGDGTMTQRLTPTAVFGTLTFDLISAGNSHTCGAATDGEAYCWGSTGAVLGNGSSGNRFVPTRVAFP